MVSGTSEETSGGACDPSAAASSGQPLVADSGEGLRGVDQGEPRIGVEGGNGADDPRPDGSAPGGAAGERDQSPDSRDQAQAGVKIPASRQRAGLNRLTKTEVALALREAGGNTKIAAGALDCSEHNVRWWIGNDVELNALYGGRNPASEPVTPPTETELLDRSEETTPTGIPAKTDINMALAVAEADTEILRKGLKELGISDATLEKLKKLDGLAQSNGHFLSISLQTTHRSYFLQTIQLTEVAENLKKRYLDPMIAPEGHAKAGQMVDNCNCSAEERAAFFKVYTEMVKEGGRAYQTMMEGTQAMVRMLQAANSDPDKPTSGKPKWHTRTTKTVKPKK